MNKKTTKACYFTCPHTPKKKSLKLDIKCHVLDCYTCFRTYKKIDGKRFRMVCGCIKEEEELKYAYNKLRWKGKREDRNDQK